MADRETKWPRLPDLPAKRLDIPGLAVRNVGGLTQILASGDLSAVASRAGVDADGVGALGLATGGAYSIRMARDRLLIVAETALPLAPGWNADGFAVTDMSGAFDVFELDGPRGEDVVAAATSLPVAGGTSPSATIVFAGVSACLYRYGEATTLRLHVERGHSAYVWQWLEKFAELSEADAT